jgi:hypothetical protein
MANYTLSPMGFDPEKSDHDYDEKDSYVSTSSDLSDSSAQQVEAESLLRENGMQRDAHQLEAQVQSAPVVPAERRTSFSTKMIFLAAYFFLNLTLTVSNKALLGKVWRHAPWWSEARETDGGCRRNSHGCSPRFTRQPPPLAASL